MQIREIDMKQKRPVPRLDRRNAIKNIDYNASNSSSSSSFDDQLSYQTSAPDLSLLGDCTSFRVEGIEGEFDRICRSLGLSGPEDFAIPTAAWEATKALSPSDNFSSPRFRDNYDSKRSVLKGSRDNGLLNCVKATVKNNDESMRENDCSPLKEDLDAAGVAVKVWVNGDVKVEDDKSQQLNIPTKSVRKSRDSGFGIKGVRPPVLSPAAVMSSSLIDHVSSTCNTLRAFGPDDGVTQALPFHLGPTGSPNENNGSIEERNDGLIVTEQEPNGSRPGYTDALPESCSDTSNDERDDDSFNTTFEPVYSISSSGRFRRSINSWQKGDFLGSGSFGTVYEGFTDDGLFFAVKEVSLLDPGSEGKQRILQLEQEISLLSQFEHDNIVQYLGTDKDDSKLYIFLELVTKGSLAKLYQKYHLRDSQVSSYTRQILNGLNYLHNRKVVHRDIKCANILVDASGSVKLADFGLAKATKLNDVQSCKGTAFWMAPEVVNRKNRGYGLAADIWSLGCTVLEMLTRQIPYSHLEGMQALFRIGRGEPPPIPDSLSRDARDFILKCLQVNPDKRPTAAQLLDHQFVKKPLSGLLIPASPKPSGI